MGFAFLSLAALSTPLLHGQIESATRLTARPARFERMDFVVMLTSHWDDPFQSEQVRLDLELTSPSGMAVKVPGYFERGKSGADSIWRTRFAPRETGAYQGRFVLTDRDGKHPSEPVRFDVAPSAAIGFLHLASPWCFRFDNGGAFRGIGENLGWEARTTDDSKHFKALHENQRYNYEYLVGQLSANGGNFFRTWMCSWNLPLEWKKVNDTTRYTDDPGHFNASAIARLDQLVQLAAMTDTYFMLTLDPHGSFLDLAWENNNYNVKNGGPAATPLDFFTNSKARAQYKDRLRYLVARWGYSPHIATWEFFNEVDNTMYGQKSERIPDEVITKWHAEMSAYLKEIDPYGRSITTSISHRDVAGLNEIATLDFNQRHIYRQTDTIPETIRRFERGGGKPYVIGEFSYEWDWNKNFDDFADKMDHDFKHGLWLGLFSPTPILPMSWWWEFFDQRKLTAYFQRVRAMDEQMIAAGSGAFATAEVHWHGDKLRHTLAVRCGAVTFVLLSNIAEKAASGQLIIPVTAGKKVSVRRYDPDLDLTADPVLSARGETDVSVPANSDVILIVTEL